MFKMESWNHMGKKHDEVRKMFVTLGNTAHFDGHSVNSHPVICTDSHTHTHKYNDKKGIENMCYPKVNHEMWGLSPGNKQ